jgi:hypothetical protein
LRRLWRACGPAATARIPGSLTLYRSINLKGWYLAMNSKLLSFLTVASAAFFIACAPVAAQWQVPDHSIPIGRGTGTGFNSVAPGPNGSMLQSQGTSSDPAYTTFPLAMLGLCGTEFSFPVYVGGAWQCSTSSAPLAAVLNGTLNLNPLAASLQRGLNITTSGPTTGPIDGSIFSNLIQGSFNATLTGPDDPGTGGCACWGLFQVSASTGPNFDGLESYGFSVGNVTSGPNMSWTDVVGASQGFSNKFAWPNSRGYGGVSSALVGPSGTNAQISGHEFGVRLETATGVPIRYGINIDNYGPHTATGMDTAISIMGGTAGGSWKNGIVFTNPGNALAPALATNGKVMSFEVATTVDSVFDLHNVAVSNYIISSPHALLTGSGTLVLGDTSSAGGFALKGAVGGNVYVGYQLGSGIPQWTHGIDGSSSNRWYIYNTGLSQIAFQIDATNNIPRFPALNAAGIVCNNSSGDLSTSTTGCSGVTLAAGNGGTGRATLTANAFLTGGGTSPLNMVAITGLVLGNGASAPTAYAGTSCTNQFPRSLNASGVATCANVALGTDVTGAGTGVLAALAANVGSAGSFVTFNGAGGTPSSIMLTNGAGLPVSALGVGSIELGNASDTTISRVSAGVIAVEGVTVPNESSGSSNSALGITFATPGDLAVTSYLSRAYSYVKHGRVVQLSFNVLATITHTTASGDLRITGLPFTAANDSTAQWRGTVQFGGITKAGYTDFAAGVGPNSTLMVIVASKSASDISVVTAADTPSGGTVRLQGSVTYWTD